MLLKAAMFSALMRFDGLAIRAMEKLRIAIGDIINLIVAIGAGLVFSLQMRNGLFLGKPRHPYVLFFFGCAEALERIDGRLFEVVKKIDAIGEKRRGEPVIGKGAQKAFVNPVLIHMGEQHPIDSHGLHRRHPAIDNRPTNRGIDDQMISVRIGSIHEFGDLTDRLLIFAAQPGRIGSKPHLQAP